MALKIKANDYRIRATITAMLLLARDRLARGETADLLAEALRDYREDPDAYKEAHPRRDRDAVRETGPLKSAKAIAYYQKLVADAEALAEKFARNKRQFNSLTELDNFLAFTLRGPE
jgi:hypothetical protein